MITKWYEIKQCPIFLERHEALPIVAALHQLTMPRLESIQQMAVTLKALGYTLDDIRLESYSYLPPAYNLCQAMLSWRRGETIQREAKTLRPGDAIALALLMQAPLLVASEIFEQVGMPLAEGETPELLFARFLLRQSRIVLPAGKELRLGHSKAPLREALVKEFKSALSGKAPILPEEDMEERRRAYLAFLLGDDWPGYVQNESR